MSQKFQMITLLAMVGSLGSSGAVGAGLKPGEKCENFTGLNVTKCFAATDDCYMKAEDLLCHTKDPAACESEKRQSPKECGPSTYTDHLYKYKCHWGTKKVKDGERDVVVGHRQVGTGKKDKNKNEIMKTEDIMGKEDIMKDVPACVK